MSARLKGHHVNKLRTRGVPNRFALLDMISMCASYQMTLIICNNIPCVEAFMVCVRHQRKIC